MAQALSARAINQREKTRIRNLQCGPRKRGYISEVNRTHGKRTAFNFSGPYSSLLFCARPISREARNRKIAFRSLEHKGAEESNLRKLWLNSLENCSAYGVCWFKYKNVKDYPQDTSRMHQWLWAHQRSLQWAYGLFFSLGTSCLVRKASLSDVALRATIVSTWATIASLGIIFQQMRNKTPWRFVRSRSCIWINKLDLRRNFPGNLAVIYLKFDSSAPCGWKRLLRRRRTVKYGPLNGPITMRVLTERYNKI